MDFSEFLSKKNRLSEMAMEQKEIIREKIEKNVSFEWISNEDHKNVTIMSFNMKFYNESISMKIQKIKNSGNLEMIFFSTIPNARISINIEGVELSQKGFIDYTISKLITEFDYVYIQMLNMEENTIKENGYQKDTIGGLLFNKMDTEIIKKQTEIIENIMEIKYFKTKDLKNSVIEHLVEMKLKEKNIQIYVSKEFNTVIVRTIKGMNLYDNNLQKIIENILEEEDILQVKEVLLSFGTSKKNILRNILFEKVIREYKKTNHYKMNNLY